MRCGTCHASSQLNSCSPRRAHPSRHRPGEGVPPRLHPVHQHLHHRHQLGACVGWGCRGSAQAAAETTVLCLKPCNTLLAVPHALPRPPSLIAASPKTHDPPVWLAETRVPLPLTQTSPHPPDSTPHHHLPLCTYISRPKTNTHQVGTKTRAADRVLGAHFFSPAHIMPLLEIVRTERTSKQVRAGQMQ